MKRIKKYFASVIAALLIFSNIPAFAANADIIGINMQYSDADKENFKLSYNFYKTIGVINEDLNIDSTLSRGSWADIVLRFFGHGAGLDAYKNVHFFDDYDASYDKIGAVNLAAQFGLMGEYDDGKFSPATDVNYEDVCVTLVKGLGYAFLAEQKGGGYDEYLAVAANIGLLKGVKATRGYPIVASQALKLLDNAADTEMLGGVIGDKDGVYKKGGTVLSEIHGLNMKKGIVTANSRSSLFSADKLSEGKIEIDNVLYDYEGDTEDLLGYRVCYYVSEREDNTVVYLGKSGNSVRKIDFDRITDYSNRKYTYKQEGSDKEREEEIPRGCAVIYNGVALTDGFSSNLPMYTSDGSLTFISNNSDNIADVLLIEAYRDFWLGHIDVGNEIIYSKHNEADTISFKDYETVEIYDGYGAETVLGKLAVNNVLSVAETPDGETVRIYVSTQTVTGKITTIDDNDFGVYLTVGDIDYKLSDICDETGIYSGYSGIFYLNRKEHVVGYEEKLISQLGYLIRAANTGALKEDVVFKVLTSKGEITSYPCAEKVTVEGVGVLKESDLYNLMLNGGAEVKSQLMLYELNSGGEINSLDLLGYSARIRQWSELKSQSIKYYSSASTFTDGKSFLNAGATVFFVPKNTDGADPEEYSVQHAQDLQNDGEYASDTLPAYTYQLDGTELGVDAVVADSSFRSRKYGLGIVNSITKTVDESGEVCTKIEIYQYSTLTNYYLYEGDAIDVNSVNAASSAFSARALEGGDVVSLDYIPLNGKRRLTRLSMIYDVSADEYLYSNPSTTSFNVETRYFMADVQNKDNKLLAVVLNGGTLVTTNNTTVGSGADTSASNYEIHRAGGSVYIYKGAKKNAVVKGNVNDIASFKNAGAEYSKIWMFTSKETPQMIYIVNNN